MPVGIFPAEFIKWTEGGEEFLSNPCEYTSGILYRAGLLTGMLSGYTS